LFLCALASVVSGELTLGVKYNLFGGALFVREAVAASSSGWP
jgi:hypothetical protein